MEKTKYIDMLTDADVNLFARTKCDLIDRSGSKCSYEQDNLGKLHIKYYDIVRYKEFCFNDFECEDVYKNPAQENDTDNLKTWMTTEWRRFMVKKAKSDPHFADYKADLKAYLMAGVEKNYMQSQIDDVMAYLN